MRWKGFAFSLLLSLAAGCAVGPDYQRPVPPLPEAFRGAEPGIAHDPAARTFADIQWFELLKDSHLQHLIRVALKENHDVRIAAQRILEYQARLTSTQSSLFPSLQAGGKTMDTRTSEQGLSAVPAGTAERSAYQVFADFTWEIDFFGRIRRATEASEAEFFAAEENQKLIIQTLVTGLAQAYIELLAFDLELDIARRAVQSRQESFRLVKIRQEGGVDSLLALRQAEGLVYAASKTIPDLERQVDQKENEITSLLGANPGPVLRGRLLDQHLKVEVPSGLPSSLLERRPDIRTAEGQLIAANARIGEAKAQLFPRIALTATGGYESQVFSNLLDPASRFWTLVPSLTQPLFAGGRLLANVEAAEARKEQALLTYQKTIQLAFREVADSLVGYRKLQEKRQEQEWLVNTLTDQARLARLRYQGGVTSYLEVLDSERQLFEAELQLAQDRGNEILSVIALYRALGGGWAVEEAGP